MATSAHPIAIAVAAIVDDARVLLVHRHPDRRNYPNCWDLPGGHVELGESSEDAVRRECREELGIDVEDPSPMRLTCSDPALRKDAFLVTRWTGTPRNMSPDEHDDLAWFPANDLDSITLSDPACLTDLASAVRRAR